MLHHSFVVHLGNINLTLVYKIKFDANFSRLAYMKLFVKLTPMIKATQSDLKYTFTHYSYSLSESFVLPQQI